MNLLILYPINFQCFSKFSRKLRNILSEAELKRVIFPSDSNGYIKSYFDEYPVAPKLVESENWQSFHITHAIVFDDGEEFSAEWVYLKDKDVILRRVKIAITRVVNIKKDTRFNGRKSTSEYQYIGRGSYWGNPYSMSENGDDREEVIRKYKYDFDYEKFPNKEKNEVYKLAGKRLGCFCKPEACHGDILADFLNSWDDGK